MKDRKPKRVSLVAAVGKTNLLFGHACQIYLTVVLLFPEMDSPIEIKCNVKMFTLRPF